MRQRTRLVRVRGLVNLLRWPIWAVVLVTPPGSGVLLGLLLGVMPCVVPGVLLGLIPGDAAAQVVAMDTTSLAFGRYAEAGTLLEKTIFRVDVARLRVRFGTETAQSLESLLDGRSRSDTLADSAAAVAIQARDAWASLTFQRNVDFGRFLDGIRDGVKVAEDAGLLGRAFARSLADSLQAWYAPLRERGVREGDLMIYRIRGDSLRTVFRSVDGQVFVDQVDVGPQPRLSVLGGFLARGSDFRKGLLNSLFDPGSTSR